MKKKLIIGISALLGVIVVVITLCFTVFTVKTVEVDFRTSTTLSWNSEEIRESAKIDYGKCVLFLSKKGYIDKLEKENPYLEVINIETVFPSKLVIHCAEREALFKVQHEGQTFLCDKDLKVLKIIDSGETGQALPLSGLTILSEVEEGGFLKVKEEGIKVFLSAMVENGKSLPQVLGFCRELSLSQNENPLTGKTETDLKLITSTSREITILNIDSTLNFKLQRMFLALPMLYDLLVTNGDYTNAEVDRCALVIGNQITDPSELYVHIYLDGEVISSPNKG